MRKKILSLVLVSSLFISLFSFSNLEASNYFGKSFSGNVTNDYQGDERVQISPSGGLLLYSASGELLPNFPVFKQDFVFINSPVLVDLDGDNLKEIFVIAKNSGFNHYASVIDINGSIITEVDLGESNIYYDPVVLKSLSSGKDSVLAPFLGGELVELSLDDGLLTAETKYDFNEPFDLSVDKYGQNIYFNFPDTNYIKVLNWNTPDAFNNMIEIATEFSILYQAIDDSLVLYGVDREKQLLAFDFSSGFSTSTTSSILFQLDKDVIAPPIIADVLEENIGKEIVLELSDKKLKIFSLDGTELKTMSAGSFINTGLCSGELGSIYCPKNAGGGEKIEENAKVKSIPYANIKFDVVSSTNQAPSINILEPNGVDDVANVSTTITWTDEDVDDNAIINFYYTPSSTAVNGILINDNLIYENNASDSLTWYTADVPEGEYYVYASIYDGENEIVYDVSDGPIIIDHEFYCLPPFSDDWIVDVACTLREDVAAPANVRVKNGAVLVISPTGRLNIDLFMYHLYVDYGSGVLIKKGGKIY